jgi:hypothetical protein
MLKVDYRNLQLIDIDDADRFLKSVIRYLVYIEDTTFRPRSMPVFKIRQIA